jgi:pimeloyl-ACP methyl ester carboxylesterase
MIRKTLAALAFALAAVPALAQPAAETGHVAANGLEMYYEVKGEGPPLLVLHGAYMSADAMAPLTDRLAETHRVITPDLQAHGRTADIDRPITYEAMADDAAALLAALDVAEADVFGYSMGGGVALQLAIRHPDRVGRLVVASAGFRSEGLYPELVEMIGGMTAESFAGSPMETEYLRLAPDPAGFPTLVEKLVALDTAPQDWPEEDIRGIAAPTLVISADADVIRPEHSVELYRLLGGGPSEDFMTAPADAQLAILPGTTHMGMMEKLDLLVPMVEAFLGAES